MKPIRIVWDLIGLFWQEIDFLRKDEVGIIFMVDFFNDEVDGLIQVGGVGPGMKTIIFARH